MAHAYARTALYTHALGMIIFVLCLICYAAIGFDTCETRYLLRLGFLPVHVIFVVAIAWSLNNSAPVSASSRGRMMQVSPHAHLSRHSCYHTMSCLSDSALPIILQERTCSLPSARADGADQQ